MNVAPQDSASFFPSTAWTSLEAHLEHEDGRQQCPHVLCKIIIESRLHLTHPASELWEVG